MRHALISICFLLPLVAGASMRKARRSENVKLTSRTDLPRRYNRQHQQHNPSPPGEQTKSNYGACRRLP